MFSVNGRRKRGKYFLIWLITIVLDVIAHQDNRSMNLLEFDDNIGRTFLKVIIILLVIENNVKRFHDMDRSGWFAFIWLLPFMREIDLLMAFLPGTKGSNKYGDDPSQLVSIPIVEKKMGNINNQEIKDES